ncbi:SKI family transcriptional corepressor 1 [Galendromus occidentalis]|uniref:SKI family transcriptional corepressor 1 n=1 Tax=Galendromus occidentalis TaxID=34638 RepID=A0AAJ7WHF7_9ACAR|nr:SKI family transcriptional corepressor 1 [Galendromus occidentalis]
MAKIGYPIIPLQHRSNCRHSIPPPERMVELKLPSSSPLSSSEGDSAIFLWGRKIEACSPPSALSVEASSSTQQHNAQNGSGDDKESGRRIIRGGNLAAGHPSEVRTVILYGIPIVALLIDGQERLSLAQISNTLLKDFSYNEIHNRRVALGITCVQCTPVQLELLRRAGAMPVSSRRCGMITKREAERLCKSFLTESSPPKLPDNFSFDVVHACAWGCRGSFVPSRYNSSRAKCIKCALCGQFFSPNKFIFHSHRLPEAKYVQPDAANYNSWRRHIRLAGNPLNDVLYAWEDVKAMFNGGSRKRVIVSSSSQNSGSVSDTNSSHHSAAKKVKASTTTSLSDQSLAASATQIGMNFGMNAKNGTDYFASMISSFNFNPDSDHSFMPPMPPLFCLPTSAGPHSKPPINPFADGMLMRRLPFWGSPPSDKIVSSIQDPIQLHRLCMPQLSNLSRRISVSHQANESENEPDVEVNVEEDEEEDIDEVDPLEVGKDETSVQKDDSGASLDVRSDERSTSSPFLPHLDSGNSRTFAHLSKEELRVMLQQETERRRRAEKEVGSVRETLEEQLRKESSYKEAFAKQLQVVRDAFSQELEQERKTRISAQQKVKEAHETLQQLRADFRNVAYVSPRNMEIVKHE